MKKGRANNKINLIKKENILKLKAKLIIKIF